MTAFFEILFWSLLVLLVLHKVYRQRRRPHRFFIRVSKDTRDRLLALTKKLGCRKKEVVGWSLTLLDDCYGRPLEHYFELEHLDGSFEVVNMLEKDELFLTIADSEAQLNEGDIFFSGAYSNRLQRKLSDLMERSGIQSFGGVLRKGVGLFEWVVEQIESGRRFHITKEEGRHEYLPFPQEVMERLGWNKR